MALTITNLSDAAKQAVIDRATNAGVSSPADILNILLAKLVDDGGSSGAKLVTVADDAALAALTTADVNVGDFVILTSSATPQLSGALLQVWEPGLLPSLTAFRVSPAGFAADTYSAYVNWLLQSLDAQTVGNANATITSGKRDVQLTAALSAARVYTLPLASAYPAGSTITFTDIANTLTAANTATLQRAGSDTVNGGTTLVLNTAGASPVLVSDGISKWNMDIRGISRGGTGSTTAAAAAVAIVNGNPINPSTIGATTPGSGTFTSLNGPTDVFGGNTANITVYGRVSGGILSFGGSGACTYLIEGAAQMKQVMGSGWLMGWASSTTGTEITMRTNLDTAISRSSAGLLQINSGTAGAFRDLCGRMLEAKTALVTGTCTVATVPSASTYARGIIYVSDESGGATIAFSDGTNWRRVADRAIVS